MKAIRQTLIWCLVITIALNSTGCGNKFFDPAQVGRFRPTPAVNIILDSLGVAEEAPSPWESATEPTPQDIVSVDLDYRLGSGDVVRIGIFELLLEGQMVTNDYVINESGKVSIPEVGIVPVAGLTETQLEQTIRDILIPDILANPTVSVALVSSQRRLCSVVGEGVTRPGRIMIPRHDFRLVDALAMAGGANQFNVTNIYVARAPEQDVQEVVSRSSFTGQRVPQPLTTMSPSRGTPVASDVTMSEFGGLPQGYRPAALAQPSFQRERQMLGMETEMTQRLWSESQKLVPAQRSPQVLSPSSYAPIPQTQSLVPGMVARGLGTVSPMQTPLTQGMSVAQPTAPAPQVEWVFENGKWKPITRTPASTTGQVPTTQVPQPQAALPSPPPTPVPQTMSPAIPVTPNTDPAQVEWVFQEGRWVPVQAKRMQAGGPTYEFGKDPSVLPLNGSDSALDANWESAQETRVIRIPRDRLMAGDQNYNIAIKPGDTIYVPVDLVGEFYIMGNVNRTGTINMTGRPVTMKQAIAMAGGLGPLAFPKKCEIVRRIDTNREEIVMVDLDKIYSGEQPDFFVKVNDTINVGTHYSSRWRAVLRNSFRAAWGFGMVYDRNFADDQFGSGFPSWLPL